MSIDTLVTNSLIKVLSNSTNLEIVQHISANPVQYKQYFIDTLNTKIENYYPDQDYQTIKKKSLMNKILFTDDIFTPSGKDPGGTYHSGSWDSRRLQHDMAGARTAARWQTDHAGAGSETRAGGAGEPRPRRTLWVG